MIYLNLRNNRITVGELLDDPRSRAVFRRRFGHMMRNPMVEAGRSLTLEQLVTLAGTKLPRKVIEETLEELKKC